MSSPTEFGSLRWSTRSDGRLRRREQLTEARRLIDAQLRAVPDTVRVLSGRQAPGVSVHELDDPPDSVLCRHAREVAEDVYSQALIGHVQRCWLWSGLISAQAGLAPDPELLYCACLLHDLALCDEHPPGPSCGCFAVSGARTAQRLMNGWGADERQRDLVGDAISRHLNVTVPLEDGIEAHLLHDAAFLDVIGSGAAHIHHRARAAVLERHPRDGFPRAFNAAMARERRERPHSRAANFGRLGSAVFIRVNPLDRTVGPRSQR